MGILDRVANLSDSVVSAIDPRLGLERKKARAKIGAFTNDGYMVPGSPRKSMRGVTATANAPSMDIDDKHQGMVALSRDFSMNSPMAVSIFRRFRTNVPGFGLQVQPRIDAKYLNISDTQAQEFTNGAMREFDMWAKSWESDYEGMASPNELQGLLYMTSIINGDVFYALPMVESRLKGWPYETTIRMIDGDLVRTPDNESFKKVPANAKIRNGIEFDKSGRFVAVWLANFYQNDNYGLNDEQKKFTRVPLYNNLGERQIFHLMDFERIGQRRGLPMLAPIIPGLKQLTRLSDSELMSNLLASFFTVFVRDNYGTGGGIESGHTPEEMIHGGGGEGPGTVEEDKETGFEYDLEMGHGNIHLLDDNKDISIAETRNKSDFEPFFRAIAVQLSAAVELPYEVVLQHFQASYSAMRGAILEAWKKWRSERYRFSNRVPQIWYENVIKEAIIKGRLQAPGFFDDYGIRTAWLNTNWIGPGMGQADPLKETKASVLKIRHGLGTHDEEYAKDTGGRWNQMIDRLARENDRMEELGFSFAPDEEVEREEIINDQDVE